MVLSDLIYEHLKVKRAEKVLCVLYKVSKIQQFQCTLQQLGTCIKEREI